MNLEIDGQVALITGAARGIGAAIARAFAAEGCQVVVLDRDLDAAEAAAKKIAGEGGNALAVEGRVDEPRSVTECLEKVLKALGPVQILINNAGFSRDGAVMTMTEAQWDEVVDVNLKGTFLMAQAVVPSMVDRRYGRIINISSRAHLGEFNKANYSAAKAGVIGLTKALSLDLGKHEITVNAIAPGLIRTERVSSLAHFDDIDRRAKLSTPIQRPGMPEDIANAALFLAARSSGFITGEVLHVTGGRYSSS
jgi:3-oxoacyl-[acyl-carrier protein] reductase